MNITSNINRYKILLLSSSLESDPILREELESEFSLRICRIRRILFQEIKRGVDLVVMEINNEGIDLNLIKKLQSKFPSIPLIAVGSGIPRELLVKAFKYGVKDFFRSPCNTELLIERINALIKSEEFVGRILR